MSESMPAMAVATCSDGWWAFGRVIDLPCMMGRRVSLLISSLPLRDFCDVRPDIATRLAHNLVFVQSSPRWAPNDTSTHLRTGNGARLETWPVEDLPEMDGRKPNVNVSEEEAAVIQATIQVPPPSVHQLQTELADLRTKLKYAAAIAPDGFRLVEGFVSATKGRETPNQTDRMAYIDGLKGYRVTDAMSGPHGFIITAPVGVAFSGVVHILERDPSRKYQPWPESLTFSVST